MLKKSGVVDVNARNTKSDLIFQSLHAGIEENHDKF
jgi:hypothetical protein